jgi:hypothetical protein
MIDHEDFSVVVKKQSSSAKTLAMGDLSRWQKQRDRAFQSLFRDRDGGYAQAS